MWVPEVPTQLWRELETLLCPDVGKLHGTCLLVPLPKSETTSTEKSIALSEPFPHGEPKMSYARKCVMSQDWHDLQKQMKTMTTGNFHSAILSIPVHDHEIYEYYLNISSWDLGFCFLFSRVKYYISQCISDQERHQGEVPLLKEKPQHLS